MLEQSGGDEKDSVREYFNGEGFDRWRRIYGTTEDVNKVQKDIRGGHATTIEKTLKWITQKSNRLCLLYTANDRRPQVLKGPPCATQDAARAVWPSPYLCSELM